MRNVRVIVVDDDVPAMQALHNWLAGEGYEVVSFSRPVVCPVGKTEAVSCEKQKKCADVYLTDFDMPDINGIELFERLSKIGCKIDKQNKAVISGFTDEKDQMIIEKRGYSFFKKPVNLHELMDWLNGCKSRIDTSDTLVEIKLPGGLAPDTD